MTHETPLQSHLPERVWLLRHGQSAGNVARDAAEASGLDLIDIADRDMDVPLSPLGRQQAASVGRWFGTLGEGHLPDVILCSPYVRAKETADLLLGASGLSDVRIRVDERLREKEFGVVDRLTPRGIQRKFPDLHEQRSHVGKFYFRPPGGESWCDVILRLRSLLEMMTREYRGKRVLVCAHQVVVNCSRYLIEEMGEADILAIDRDGDVPNCSVTSYIQQDHPRLGQRLTLDLHNFVAPLIETGTTVTAAADVPAAPKS